MNRVSRTVACAVLAAAGLAAPVMAQDENQAGQPQPPSKSPSRAVAEQPKVQRFDLNFPGGTVADFVKLLQSTPGINANIVVSTEAEMFVLGKMSLRQVTLNDAAQAIRTAKMPDSMSGDRYIYQIRLEERGEMWLVDRTIGGTKQAAFNERSYDPVTVMDLPSGQGVKNPEVVLSAIEGALNMLGSSAPRPMISYHKETGLLFLAAQPAQVDTVRQVLSAIYGQNEREKAEQLAFEASRLTQALEVPDLSAALNKVKGLKETCEKIDSLKVETAARVATLEARLEVANKQVDEERRRAGMMVERAEAEREAMRKELAQYRAMVDSMRAERDRQRQAERGAAENEKPK